MKRALSVVQVVCLCAAAGYAFARAHAASGGHLPSDGMSVLWLAWMVSPYVWPPIAAKVLANERFGPQVAWASTVVAVAMLAFSVCAYADISSTSTAGLVFLFAPLWMWIGGPILWLVVLSAALALRRVMRRG